MGFLLKLHKQETPMQEKSFKSQQVLQRKQTYLKYFEILIFILISLSLFFFVLVLQSIFQYI